MTIRNLLHIAASARGEQSHSYQAARKAIAHLQARYANLTVTERNLGHSPLPHPNNAFVQASLMPISTRTTNELIALAPSETLIDEFDHADFVLISTPMHNFTIPSALKAWIDYIVRPHRSFRITESGKQGLLHNKPIRIVMACGGKVDDSDKSQPDFATPYLRYVFSVVGISDVQVLTLDKLNRGDDAIQAAHAKLLTWCNTL